MDSPTVSTELIAFRFLVLSWFGALLILGYAGYAHVQATQSQTDVAEFLRSMLSCETQAMKTTPACNQNDDASQRACFERTDACSNRSMPGWGQGLDASIAYRDEMALRAENAAWFALVGFGCVTAIFYGVRWALTGRLRPLWLLRRRKD